MKRFFLIGAVLFILIVTTFSMASEDWLVYINNKPFTGNISVSGGDVMVSIKELSEMMKFNYEYNPLTECLKIDNRVYPGLKSVRDQVIMVSLNDVAKLLQARYSYDPQVHIVSIQTFKIQVVINEPTPIASNPTPTPQQTGNEVQVKDIRTMTDGELMEKNQFNVSTIGVTGNVENTAKVKANDVVVTVLVKDGSGKVSETLTSQIGTLDPGASKKFDLFFFDGSRFYDPKNPAIVYPGVQWNYEGKATFKLEQAPEATPAGNIKE